MARSNTEVIGPISIVVGGLLVLGGLMFLLVTLLMDLFPRAMLIPPLVQIVLGLLGSTAGFFLWRGHTAAKLFLLFVGIGIVANIVYLVSVFFATMGS